MRRRFASYAALVALALAPLPALAQPSAAAPAQGASEEQRTTLYKDGVTLANAGRWDDAVKKFRQVVAIRSAPAALFTLGQAEEHTGQLAAAERSYEKALSGARTAHAADVASAAEKALSAIVPRIPRLLVKLAVPADGAAATLDGAACALGEPIKVDPGDHAVVVRAPGKRAFESRVHVAEAQSLDVTATLSAEAPPPTAPPPSPPPPPPPMSPPSPEPASPSRFPVGPVVLGGAGVVAGVVGVVVRLTGQSSYDNASAQCGPAGCPSPQVVDDASGARTQILVGTVVLGVGVAAIAGAGVWWLLRPKASPSPTNGLGLGVVPAKDGAFATVRGSF